MQSSIARIFCNLTYVYTSEYSSHALPQACVCMSLRQLPRAPRMFDRCFCTYETKRPRLSRSRCLQKDLYRSVAVDIPICFGSLAKFPHAWCLWRLSTATNVSPISKEACVEWFYKACLTGTYSGQSSVNLAKRELESYLAGQTVNSLGVIVGLYGRERPYPEGRGVGMNSG